MSETKNNIPSAPQLDDIPVAEPVVELDNSIQAQIVEIPEHKKGDVNDAIVTLMDIHPAIRIVIGMVLIASGVYQIQQLE